MAPVVAVNVGGLVGGTHSRRWLRAFNKQAALGACCAVGAACLLGSAGLLLAPDKTTALAALAAPTAAPATGILTVAPSGDASPWPSPSPEPQPPAPSPAVQPTPPRVNVPPFPFQTGVNVLVYGNDPAFASKTAAQLDHLVQLHVNSVSFVFPIYQASWTATQVYADPAATPSPDNMRLFIREAHRRHLRVMIRPLLDEASLHPMWRGTIAPANRSAWFASYTTLLVAYARLAQAEGAETFDLGTEFKSLEGDTARWLSTLRTVRGVFHGQVTYSAHWQGPYPAFGWALDFLSIDAFYDLSVPAGATQQQLVRAWAGWVAQAAAVGYAFGKPVVFTELGTTSEVASYQQPWVWHHGSGLSLETQRVYYAASCQAVKGPIRGIYWWEFDLQPLASPLTDPGFDPQGKPAELEIARCYR